MLKLVDIKKDYVMADETVEALKGVDVSFRRNEFVAILGQSGCGKTTLLNIIGGLDRYTSGDLIIEGKSTKDYVDNDWDTYRNHSIGFIFQSYNLIGHINILKNVELALTISGIDKKERKERAEKALEMVGLGGQGKKKPNQLSGGQMQRVAIARALINNPEIVLADEPTGALDSETSIQIMELLKEVAKDRLVIMVTHNPVLAQKYANRIITMKDGVLLSDTNPYEGESVKEREAIKIKRQNEIESKGSKKQTSMSFWTAMNLSFTNLLTKKTRSILISFAASIGIIGIALVLSLSYGFNGYVEEIQTNAMSRYPMSVRRTNGEGNYMDIVGSSFQKSGKEKYPDSDEVTENAMMTDIISKTLITNTTDTRSFKKYIEDNYEEKFKPYVNDISYDYFQGVNIYSLTDFDGKQITYPNRLEPVGDYTFDNYVYNGNTYRSLNNVKLNVVEQGIFDNVYPVAAKDTSNAISMLKMIGSNAFGPLMNNQEVLDTQFDVLEGHLPQNINEVVIKLNESNEIPDIYLYQMGVKDISYMMSKYMYSYIQSNPDYAAWFVTKPAEDPKYKTTIQDLMGLEFAMTLNTQNYKKIEIDKSDASQLAKYPLGYYYQDEYTPVKGETPEQAKVRKQVTLNKVLNESLKLKVVGVVRPKRGVKVASFEGAVGYHPDLYEYLVNQSNNPTSDSPFKNYHIIQDQIDAYENGGYNVLTGNVFTDKEAVLDTGFKSNMKRFGHVDYSTPEVISFFPKDFTSKNFIKKAVDEYNDSREFDNEKVILGDPVASMLDSVQIIVDSVGYVLIAFISISLIVSSIMIGIITYVSVLERTKEIGVLRSIGARKKDISRVFNAETLIIGLVAGVLGITIASLLNLPIMAIINHLTEIGLVVIVPWYGALILPAISIMLTVIAGLIPSSIAAKKDPVIALRTE